ncbi:MAG: metallophosphoesterase [Phycisphaerae bacterium]|nr:metallophosphoesterase [Phycisphaerae bacterium]
MNILPHAVLSGMLSILPMAVGGCKVCSNRTPAALQFGVAADVQYAQKPPAMGRHYARSLDALKRCVEEFNRRSPAFVIQLGDLIDGGENAQEDMREAVSVYDALAMPHYHLLGNHDFSGLPRSSTMRLLGLEQAWYAFDVQGWRFVVLDTQDLAIEGGWEKSSLRYQQSLDMLIQLQAAGAANAQTYNGGLGSQQLVWLDAQLTDADRQGMPVIVFGHLPLMPSDEKHIAWNAEQVVSVFEKHCCVRAYFSGHRHSGGYTLHNGIHYITLEAMVDSADTDGAWAIVKLAPQTIIIEGTGAVASRTLELPPHKAERRRLD